MAAEGTDALQNTLDRLHDAGYPEKRELPSGADWQLYQRNMVEFANWLMLGSTPSINLACQAIGCGSHRLAWYLLGWTEENPDHPELVEA